MSNIENIHNPPINTDLADVIRSGAGRGLDFINLDELRKRTGIVNNEVLKFAMCEMLCNSLDTDATEIYMEIKTEDGLDWLTISDNGSKKITKTDLELILDFENKASSKRGFLRVSRGYLGNALKCIFGYSYALTYTHPEITITSHGFEYRIRLRPDKVEDKIKHDKIEPIVIEDDNRNTFKVAFPSILPNPTLAPIIIATSMVNPKRRISVDLWGKKGVEGESLCEELRRDTSVLWYTPQDFRILFDDYLRTKPVPQLKEFIALFRGLTRKPVIRDILHDLEVANHDCGGTPSVQFVPATPISFLSDTDIGNLCRIMKAHSKPISKRSLPQILGMVGEKQFESVRKRNGWDRLRYTLLAGTKDENTRAYPYIIELAVFDRSKDDTLGLQVYQCVNFMASTEDIFTKSFGIPYRIGRVGIKPEMPVTVLVHLVCPVLQWLNYGKSGLYDSGSSKALEKAFDKLLPIPKTPRVYHEPPPPKTLSWVPSGKIGDEAYEERLKDFAKTIKEIQSARTNPVKFSVRGWSYVLEGFGKIDKGDFKKSEKAMNDCRKIGFLPLDFVATDQDITRQFGGIHVALDSTGLLEGLRNYVKNSLKDLPAQTTDYWTDEKYYIMMCVEKGDLRNLFEPICNAYHIPIVSSKGWSPLLLRSYIVDLAKRAKTRGLIPVLLLFYDLDIKGREITEKFRKNLEDMSRATGWHPTEGNLIIDRFGLNKEDVIKYGLTWIDNLKTSSGREPKYIPQDYIAEIGYRKCEANALFKNDETLKSAERMCILAIVKYYGIDALERFKKREEESKEKLKEVYDNPVWDEVDKAVKSIIDSIPKKEDETIHDKETPEVEEEVEAKIQEGYYGICPSCGEDFDFDDSSINKLVRCRACGISMRLRKATKV